MRHITDHVSGFFMGSLKTIFTVVVFVLFVKLPVISTTPVDASSLFSVGEHIKLVTDRNMYAVEELLYFRIIYSKSEQLQGLSWSKVVYLELLNPEGKVEVQQKLPLKEDGACGSLALPQDMITGNYYLRAYTKWMSNFGPNAFAYAKIIVINPFDSHLFTSVNESKSEKLKFKEEAGYTISESTRVQTDKQSYKKREKVSINIKSEDSFDSEGVYTISVVKTNTLDSLYMAGSIEVKGQCKAMALGSIVSLPENRGMSCSGSMIDVNGAPVPEGKTVNLSIIGDVPYFAQTTTLKGGRFNFTLPDQNEVINLFVCPAEHEGSDVGFMVNSGFANYHQAINSESFELTQAQLNQARELIVNRQLMSLYRPEGSMSERNNKQQNNKQPSYFYGIPEKRVFLKDYIVLPNLGEVFQELVPEVLLLKRNKIPYFRVTNENYWSSTMPLVLLDQVPIYDLNTILGIHSSKFEWIDVINTSYVKGGRLYQGIISIVSKENDMAGAELPKGGAFFNFNGFDKQNLTKIAGHTQSEKYIPDLRNTLYWQPGFYMSSRVNNYIEFFTADVKGAYTVVVRRFNKLKNTVDLSTCEFVVE